MKCISVVQEHHCRPPRNACNSHMERLTILPAERVQRNPPAHLKPRDQALFAHEYLREIDEARACRLEGVDMLPNGYLIAGSKILPETFAVPRHGKGMLKAQLRAAEQGIRSRHVALIDHGLAITDEFSNGFFHWICDDLPRLEALELAMPGERSRVLVVPAMADFPYVLQSLAAYALGGVHVLRPHERARFSELLVLSQVAPTGNYRPALMRAVRARFRARAGVSAPMRRLFISRAGAPKRRIANEAELYPVLERWGFELFVPERLSFEEQVRAAASAAIFAGNHGAGLTNMCWMNPGARVLEIRRRGDMENNCYYSLACALDLEYQYLLCDVVSESVGTHLADFIVDPGVLERRFAATLGD